MCNNFAMRSHTALKSVIQTTRSYFKLTCECEPPHILSNTKVSAAKVAGESLIKVRPLLVRHRLCNRLLKLVLQVIKQNCLRFRPLLSSLSCLIIEARLLPPSGATDGMKFYEYMSIF